MGELYMNKKFTCRTWIAWITWTA